MSDKRLAAAFFLRPVPDEPGQELLERAGATDIGPVPGDPEDPSGLIPCRWAGMSCLAFLAAGPAWRLLVIFFHQSAFLETLPDDEEGPGASALLGAFARACEALRPYAGVVVTHPDQADVDVLSALGGAILEADLRRLAAERFGLLYVADELASYQDGEWMRPDRDELPLATGRLVFAARGAKRWW